MSTLKVDAWMCDRAACGHVWYSPTKPKRCASCKSPYWDRVAPKLLRAEPDGWKPISAIEALRGAVPGVTVASELPRKIRGAKLQDEAFVPFEEVE